MQKILVSQLYVNIMSELTKISQIPNVPWGKYLLTYITALENKIITAKVNDDLTPSDVVKARYDATFESQKELNIELVPTDKYLDAYALIKPEKPKAASKPAIQSKSQKAQNIKRKSN